MGCIARILIFCFELFDSSDNSDLRKKENYWDLGSLQQIQIYFHFLVSSQHFAFDKKNVRWSKSHFEMTVSIQENTQWRKMKQM